jgi:deazaflavin-dependent oxidoreductase (nitroreductase family)
MPLEGEYEPSTWKFAADHVQRYEGSGGTEATTIRGMRVVVLTTRGRRTGKVRKSPLMRVEHDGRYAAVGSIGGAPKNPVWVYNLRANPEVTLQDGLAVHDMRAREVTGAEKAEWWKRATDAYPPYDEYQAKTERVIPVFVLEPRS